MEDALAISGPHLTQKQVSFEMDKACHKVIVEREVLATLANLDFHHLSGCGCQHTPTRIAGNESFWRKLWQSEDFILSHKQVSFAMDKACHTVIVEREVLLSLGNLDFHHLAGCGCQHTPTRIVGNESFWRKHWQSDYFI